MARRLCQCSPAPPRITLEKQRKIRRGRIGRTFSRASGGDEGILNPETVPVCTPVGCAFDHWPRPAALVWGRATKTRAFERSAPIRNDRVFSLFHAYCAAGAQEPRAQACAEAANVGRTDLRRPTGRCSAAVGRDRPMPRDGDCCIQ